MSRQSFVVAGIGTDVGKSIVSAVLAEAWQADYWKPVQAGSLDFTDTDYVKSLVSNTISQFHHEVYRLTQPMSPHAAAEIDQVEIEQGKLKIPETKNILLIELAGGLMVPLKKYFLNVDLMQQWNLPAILVTRNYLGSINHTLLSIEVLQERNIPIAGIIFSGPEVKPTEEVILQYSGLKCLGYVRELETIDKSSIAQAAESFVPLKSKLI